MLIIIFLIGVIYALPNVFRDDPAIQISPTGEHAQSLQQILVLAESSLQKANLSFIKAEIRKSDVLLRFASTDIQLSAEDVLKASLGEDYTVAPNIASRSPKWLASIGSYPLKLGLDLRGGVDLLYEVDTNSLIKGREEGDVRSISDILRQAEIRYAGIERLQPHGVIINFRDSATLSKAHDELKSHLQDYVFTSLEQGGEHKLQLTMTDAAALKVGEYAIDQTMNTLRNRVNALGVSEALVQRQGANHISVSIPGMQDTARAKEIIGKTATLKFQMVDIEHDAATAAISGDIPLGARLYDYEGRHVLLKDQIILQGNSITYADAGMSQDGRPSVNVHLGGGGESTFHRVTSENIGKPMAVVYIETKPTQQMVNGKLQYGSRIEERVISIATIQSALGNNFEITGLASQKYASDLALLLRSGALGAPLNVIQELIVGPSMGKINIEKGLLSVVVGFVFVVFFMALYYRLFGLIADMALFLNLIFIVAILSILGATLTLPSIAGIVLTVGMSVDSNVLIYERIREELRNGMSPQASIYAGYQRALTTIVDANVATLIVAIVLYALGSGPVKGFAVVLTIGLMTSMLTAIVFTRSVVNLIYGRRAALKRLSIGA